MPPSAQAPKAKKKTSKEELEAGTCCTVLVDVACASGCLRRCGDRPVSTPSTLNGFRRPAMRCPAASLFRPCVSHIAEGRSASALCPDRLMNALLCAVHCVPTIAPAAERKEKEEQDERARQSACALAMLRAALYAPRPCCSVTLLLFCMHVLCRVTCLQSRRSAWRTSAWQRRRQIARLRRSEIVCGARSWTA